MLVVYVKRRLASVSVDTVTVTVTESTSAAVVAVPPVELKYVKTVLLRTEPTCVT
jgi:hypothetical protein